MTDNRFTKEELQDLFGDSIPMEAVKLIFQCPPEWTMEKLRSEIRKVAPPAPKRLSDEELVGCLEDACVFSVDRSWDDRHEDRRIYRSQILERMKQKGPTRGEVDIALEGLLIAQIRLLEERVSLDQYSEKRSAFLSMFPEGDQ